MMLSFRSAAIFTQFITFLCLNFWQLFLATSASPPISNEAKQRFGQLIIINQIGKLQKKATDEIVPLLKDEWEKEQYRAIVSELSKVSLLLWSWTETKTNTGKGLDEFSDVRRAISEFKSKITGQNEVASISRSDDGREDGEALSKFRSDVLKLMDQVLVQILLLQPAEEFSELGKQIERQKQEIRQQIEQLVDTVTEKMRLYTEHTDKETGFIIVSVSGFIKQIVEGTKRTIRKDLNKLLKSNVFKILLPHQQEEMAPLQHDGLQTSQHEELKASQSQHGANKMEYDPKTVALENVVITLKQFLAENDPLIGHINEQMFTLAREETILPEGMSEKKFLKEFGKLEKIGEKLNKAAATIHADITKGLADQHWVKQYNNLRTYELLSSVSREIFRLIEAKAKAEPQTPEQREKSLLFPLWLLVYRWLEPNLAKIDPRHLGTFENDLSIGSKGKEPWTMILPDRLSVNEIAKHEDPKVGIKLSAMHMLFRYEQLTRMYPADHHIMMAHYMHGFSASFSSSSLSSFFPSSGSRVDLKGDSVVELEIKKLVEMDIKPEKIGERVYQKFCVVFAKDKKKVENKDEKAEEKYVEPIKN